MAMIKIGGSDSEGGALAKGMGAAMKALGRKKKTMDAKEKESVYQPPPPSKIACPDCGKDQIEHSNGFVCRCAVRKVIAK